MSIWSFVADASTINHFLLSDFLLVAKSIANSFYVLGSPCFTILVPVVVTVLYFNYAAITSAKFSFM